MELEREGNGGIVRHVDWEIQAISMGAPLG